MKKSKRLILGLGILVGVAGLAIAARQSSGWKGNVSSTPVNADLSVRDVWNVGVYNSGTNDMWAMANCTLTEFTNAVDQANATPIPAGQTVDFNGSTFPKTPIRNVYMQTDTAPETNYVYIGGF